MVQPGYVGLELSGPDSRALLEAIDRVAASAGRRRAASRSCCAARASGSACASLTERQFPQLTVLSYEEILPSVPVQVHAQVEV